MQFLSQAIRDRYRCAENIATYNLVGPLAPEPGFFRFGSNTLYGRCCKAPDGNGHQKKGVEFAGAGQRAFLPFDVDEVVSNLQCERYASSRVDHAFLKQLYYWLRPLTNQAARIAVQRFYARKWQSAAFPEWPVDTTIENLCEDVLLRTMCAQGVEQVPFIWFWPRGASGCVLMTHDVEASKGKEFCRELLKIDDSFGVAASYEIVPEERYEVEPAFLDSLRSAGAEIVVQDLNHDGTLYNGKAEFLRRMERIQHYAHEFGATGFRAAILYRNPEWYEALPFAYDMSIPNVAHLDPQRGGCCTVMPYFIGSVLELPVTTTQDYTLLHILNQWSIDLWKEQIARILKKNGLISFIVHPDYIGEARALPVYRELLRYLSELRKRTALWFALPREINEWWRARDRMTLRQNGNEWQIEGEGADRAVLAFAKNENGKLIYEFAGSHVPV
jgi:hypothetical protein